MTPVDLEMRAELTIWPSQHPTQAAEGRTFATLREALVAAAQAIEAEDAQTWIITEASCPTSAPVGQNEGLPERRMAGSS